MGIEEDKIEQIIDAHSETVDALKSERDKYKSQSEDYDSVKSELDKMKADSQSNNADSWKVKYETEHEEFKTFKKSILDKETLNAKTAAYKSMLKDAGISDKRIDTVLKVSDVKSVELDDEGKIKDADSLIKSIKDEWSEFIVSDGTSGASTSNPPANNGGSTMTRAQIFEKDDKGRYKMSASERQKAIQQNANLFS